MSLSQDELDFFEARQRIMLTGDAGSSNAPAGKRDASSPSPTGFQPYPFQRFTRQQARVLEVA